MLGLVSYGDSDNEDSDSGQEAPATLFGALPTPQSKERQREVEKKKKKDKKKKKEKKKEKKKAEKALEETKLQEQKKKNPYGVVMKRISINGAPSLSSAASKVNEALQSTPEIVEPVMIAEAVTDEPEPKRRVVIIDQRRRGYEKTGKAAMGSFSVVGEQQPEFETEVQHAIAPSSYGNATKAGMPTLSGRYYSRMAPEEGVIVPGPQPLPMGEYTEASHTLVAPGYPTQDCRQKPGDNSNSGIEVMGYSTNASTDEVQLDPELKKMLGKNAMGFDPSLLVDINQQDLTRKTRAEIMEAEFDAQNPAPDVDVAARFYNPKSGKDETTQKGSKLHKRKHQINTLAAESASREHELNKWRATGNAHRAQAKERYGW